MWVVGWVGWAGEWIMGRWIGGLNARWTRELGGWVGGWNEPVDE